MKVTDLYLVLYNLLSCAGWAYLLNLTVASYFQLNLKPSAFWNQIGSKPFAVGPVSFGGYGALHVIQSAAFLEVVHVAIGLVPSSLFANVMQVSPPPSHPPPPTPGLLWSPLTRRSDRA
jgi:hypothetical protein